MTNTPWQPLPVRLGHAEPEDALYEGVPAHLYGPLVGWITIRVGEPTMRRVCRRLRIPVNSGTSAKQQLVNQAHDITLLYGVDAALHYGTFPYDALHDLGDILDDCGSGFRVNDTNDGLEHRVDPAVRKAVTHAISDALAQPTSGSAGEHLAAAWTAAYGIQPDPVSAYSHCIKAVECAAHAIVEPNKDRATLGTMLGALKSIPHKFDLNIATAAGYADSIEAPRTMMRLLWDGQTSRHGKQTPTRPETFEEARAAVHAAATLVQWFVSGAITRLP